MLLLCTKIKIKVLFLWKGCSSVLISRGHSTELVPDLWIFKFWLKLPAFNYDEHNVAACPWKTKVSVYEKLYAVQYSNCGEKQWQNPSFFGKMPLLINCNIFQLCIDFSQLPNKHTAFILWSLTVSPVFSSSFQLSTVLLLMDWFSWVKRKNSEHLITLWPALLSQGQRREETKSPSRLVPVKAKLSRDLFFFWRQIRCSNQAVLWGHGWVPTEPLTRLIPQQHIPSS